MSSAQTQSTMQDMKNQAADAASKLQDRSENMLNSAMNTVQRGAEQASYAGQSMLDSMITRQRREQLQSQAQDFSSAHPKLATFIALNLILTGIPVGLFTIFSLATFIFSTVAGLVLGLLGAIVFTLMATGTALAVLLPTMLVTTGVACFMFFWGLVVYYALCWTAGSGSSSNYQPSESNWQTRSSKTQGGRLSEYVDKAHTDGSRMQTSDHDRFGKTDPSMQHSTTTTAPRKTAV